MARPGLALASYSGYRSSREIRPDPGGAARLWLGVRDRPRLTNCVTDRLTTAELFETGPWHAV